MNFLTISDGTDGFSREENCWGWATCYRGGQPRGSVDATAGEGLRLVILLL